MRELISVVALLLFPIAIWSQTAPSLRRITIRNLTMIGATQISPEDQQQIASEVAYSKYTDRSVAEISERLQYALQRHGFFKASATPPQVTLVSSSSSEEVIDIEYHVKPGKQYRLQEITFSNNRAFSESELRQTFPIESGETFDVEKIRHGLELLRKLYVSKGYVNFTPVAETEADDTAGTISVRVDVDEGLVFQVGALVLDGAEPVPGAAAHLLDAWKKYQGRLDYDVALNDFVRENAAYLPHAVDWHLFEMRQDPERQVLNFRLKFGDFSRRDR